MKKLNANLFGLYATVEISRESPAQISALRQEEFRCRNIYFEGEYVDWKTAGVQAQGYDAPQILEKLIDATREVVVGRAAYERDTVLFHDARVSHPLLAWLLYAAYRSSGRLAVMDFGGALGSAYYQHRRLLEPLEEFRWGIVEQAHFVAAGRSEFATETLKYFGCAGDCALALEPNFLLLSATLQYVNHPYKLLDELLSLGLPYCLIDRTTAHRTGRDRVYVQHVPAWIYAASYPVWLLDANKLESCFDRHGYEVIDQFDPYPGSLAGDDEFSAPYMGWFLQKRKVATSS